MSLRSYINDQQQYTYFTAGNLCAVIIQISATKRPVTTVNPEL